MIYNFWYKKEDQVEIQTFTDYETAKAAGIKLGGHDETAHIQHIIQNNEWKTPFAGMNFYLKGKLVGAIIPSRK